MLSLMLSRTTLHLVFLSLAGFIGAVMIASRHDTSTFEPRELSAKGSAAIGMYIEPAREARALQVTHRKSAPPLKDLLPVVHRWTQGVTDGRLQDCPSEGAGDHSLDGAKAQIFTLRQYLCNCLAFHAREAFREGRREEAVGLLEQCFSLTRALANADLRTFAGTLSDRNRLFRSFGSELSQLPPELQNRLLAYAPTREDGIALSQHLHNWVTIIGISSEDNLASLYSRLGNLVEDPTTNVVQIDKALAQTLQRPRENANWLFVGKIAWTNLAEMRENTAAIRNRAFSPTPNLDYRALMSSSATK